MDTFHADEYRRDHAALPRFATTLEAADALGIDQSNVSRAISRGHLRATRRWGLRLIHADDLADYAAYLAEREYH